LERAAYERLLGEAASLGCRAVQFIGGEPTLNTGLPTLLIKARQLGFEFVEVFTNLFRLPEHLLDLLRDGKFAVATSVYAHRAEIHDKVTARPGSFERTIRNLHRLLENGIVVRAGFIEQAANSGLYEHTREMLESMGLSRIGYDRVRDFGRGKQGTFPAELRNLCGSCAGKTLCVGPDGRVAPCIMSKDWSVGSVLSTPLGELSQSAELKALRRKIAIATEEAEDRIKTAAQCDPHKPCFPCGPDASCRPCAPNSNCNPVHCRPYCMPN
jgi:MoaA/NifB/PqqE/SkfB family radical SAM enzyme